MLRPVMEELKTEGYNIDIIDIDENQVTAIEHGIKSVPTCILYDGARPIETWVGFKPKDEIIKIWNNH